MPSRAAKPNPCRRAIALSLLLGAAIAPAASAGSFTYWDDPSASAVTLTRAAFVAKARQLHGEKRLIYVNRVVNNAARQQFEKVDTWKGFDRLVSDGYGDCEDFAIAKYQILIQAGTPPARLDFLAADDTLTPTYHAVLRYRQDDGSHLILDNLTLMMLPESKRTDLKPLVTFDRTHAAYFHDGAFQPVAPSRIVLGGQPLSERMPKLLDY
ncbi:transglutaminase-like cysteine peptidase [Salinicola sp. JS01]|uniref:transglutaminase-like cysteine peptidase n=1 Tax=Salinicola sp. JS01 TaxID=3050071 RepID=UPI00255B48B6|nr:transglutaminase-like cysteine peptidase [Salinicola sp. JS01]WIX33985.1 transglutaminase-like cysteine peptidase [Salinicola sp. JS01]